MNINTTTNSIPILFHPTKVIMIDDHVSFTNMLAGFLMLERVITKFSIPKNVIQYLIDYESQSSYNNFYQADLLMLLHYLRDKQRFLKISTIFCDYNMPRHNGIEIFKMISAITQHRYQHILFTGMSADQTRAAQKSTVVDNIFFKDKLSNNLKLFLPKLIKLEQQFFNKMYNPTTNLSLLQEPKFIENFSHLTEKYRIIEAYLIDNGQRFILLDRQANIYELLLDKENFLIINSINNTFGISIFSYEDYITEVLS